MSAKLVVPRALARSDVEEAIDYYRDEAGEDVALRFIEALSHAYKMIAARPGSGSAHYGYELDLPGLRTRKLVRFPYLIFYMEQPGHIDVWRILHAQRDIPRSMSQAD